MASSNSFKQYARGARSQLSEEVFSGGMRWTQIPLPEMQCRMLVNYDIKDMGNMLAPRPGLRVISLGKHPSAYVTTKDSPDWSGYQAIVASKHCGESAGNYEQIILGDTEGQEEDTETGLIKGTTTVMTVPNATPGDFDGIPTQEMLSVPMEETACWALYRNNTTKGIHKMARSPGVEATTIVGTFGFGNQFFNFRKKEEEAPE